jgi:hypothetical protein
VARQYAVLSRIVEGHTQEPRRPPSAAAVGVAEVRRTWEDTPFYARSELASRFMGEEVVTVQESLDMQRFSSPLVQFMLPYRMPRRKT